MDLCMDLIDHSKIQQWQKRLQKRQVKRCNGGCLKVAVERIDKLISSQSTLSRAEVKRLVKANLVRVNGQAVLKPEEKFETSDIKIEIDEKIFDFKKNIYIMLNKPKEVLCATRDTKAKTVLDLVPQELFRNGLFPAGRLDSDTTGLVIITDDGDFAHRILSPKNHIQKTYVATLAQPISETDIKRLEQGIELADGTLGRL
ncbi:MAG: rRNA pseudouridine synthase, partial [Clostridia bacterium]|nr:rRNA pseudouridine synthase [Clostridia bacterium]